MNHKDKSPHGCDVRGLMGIAQGVGDDDSEAGAQRAIRLDKVKAGLARRGFTLQQLPDGAFWVTRTGLSCTLADWHAVETFIKKAGCSA